MKRINMKKMSLSLIVIAVIFNLLIISPKELLVVNADEYGDYYGQNINKDSDYEEKEIAESNLAAPELNEASKHDFESLILEGYVEDISQRDESLKVFVKGELEKRLYFMSPIHVFRNNKWIELDEESVSFKSMKGVVGETDISLIDNNDKLLSFESKQFDSIVKLSSGFVGKKTIDINEMIPFSVNENYSVSLDDSQTSVIITDGSTNSIVGSFSLSINTNETTSTAFKPQLDIQEIEENRYGISLRSQSVSQFGSTFSIDLEASTTTYNSSSVFLFGVRSGSLYKGNSYNPGGHLSSDNVVIGNGDYNYGYIFCGSTCGVESRNNYGIISFYNGTKLSDVIGENRTVSSAKLVMSYGTNRNANDGLGAVYQAYMLDPSRNFDVSNARNITYDNLQTYLNSGASMTAQGSTQTATGYSGTLNFDITETLQSWENSGNHHAILIRGESNAGGGFLEAAHYFLNHINSDVSGRPYIEITTIKKEPIKNDYDINDTLLYLHPFTANNRSLNAIQFIGLGFDGVSKPGSNISVYVSDADNNVVHTDNGLAFDGHRRFPQYTTDLGYILPNDVQTYYRLTSNYQLPNLLNNSSLELNKLYKVTYQSSYLSTNSEVKNSDEFIIYKVTAYDRLSRLLAFYGITNKTQFMQDNNMSDELLVEHNILFIRNPLKNKDKVYQSEELSDNDKRMIDNNLLGRNQHWVYGYEPINFNTGNFIYSNTDTGSIEYDKEILFEGFYNSMADGRVGIFGRNWSLSLYKELYFLSNGSIEFSDGTGRVLTFEKDGDTYKTPYDSSYRLEKYELRTEVISVDSGYYDQDKLPIKTDKTITYYGYKVTDNNEELIFDEVGNITSYQRSQYELPITYEYNNHDLSAIITPAGRRFTVLLNDLGLIKTIIDPEGNKTDYGYDDDLNLIVFSDQEGYRINYNYDDQYRMLSYTGREHNDIVILNVYDDQGRVISQEDALGNESKFEYFSQYTKITNYKDNITYVYKNSMGYTTRVVEEMKDDFEKVYDNHGNLIEEIKSDGLVYRYKYDINNRLIEEINPFGNSKKYTYDSKGNVISIIDFNEEVSTFEYDNRDRLVGSYYSNGKSEINIYNDQNQITYSKDINGLEKTYIYEGGSLTEVITNGQSKKFTYTGLGNLKSETDELGNTISYLYDKRSQLTSVIHPHHTEGATYDGDGNVVSRTDGNGNRTNYVYDGWSRVVEVQTLSGITKYIYDENGNVIEEIDALDNSQKYEYDINNRLITSTDKMGRTTTYFYNSKGSLVKTVNPIGQEKTFEYNELNQLVREVFIDQVQLYEYDNNNLVKTISPYGLVTQYFYDENNKLVKQIDGIGNVTNFTYDGTRLIQKEENGLIWQYTYDVKGNQTSELNPLNVLSETVYQANGQVLEVKLSGNTTTSYEYNGEGRVTSVVDLNGNTKKYEYDGNGNVVKQTDANGNTTVNKYDHGNRLVEVISPSGYKYEYIYNELGQQIKTISYDTINNTIITSFNEYDKNGNVVSETDALGRVTNYKYNELDKLIEVNKQGRITTYQYDEYGNRTKESNYIKDTYYTYVNGQVVEVEDSLGHKEIRTYNSKLQLIQTENELNQIEKFEYDEFGNIVLFTDFRGLETTYEYNALKEMVKSVDYLGIETISSYNEFGQMIYTKTGNSEISIGFDVDGTLVTTNSLTGTTKTTYDGLGNIDESKTGSYIEKSIYDQENRVSEEIDALGNSTKYRYNILNQVVEIEYADGSTVQNVYDVVGRKIMEVDQLGFETEYKYNEYDNLIEEINSLNHVTKYIYDNKDNLIQKKEPLNKNTYYEYDERNRQTKLTDAIGNKTISNYTEFDKIESVVYGNGLTKVYTYNQFFDLVSDGYVDKEPEITYEHDKYGRVSSETDKYGKSTYNVYDDFGNIVEVKVENLKYQTFFDQYNRVIQTIDERGYQVFYTYNEFNQLVTKTDSLGYEERYIYHNSGRLVETQNDLGSTISVYDSLGRLSKTISPNGAEVINVYDDRGLLVETTDALGSKVLNKYDELGRIIETTDQENHKRVYQYNELNNVVAYQEDSGRIMYFTYDLVGNQLETKYKDDRLETRKYDKQSRLLEVSNSDYSKDTYQYDIYGNLTKENVSNTEVVYTYNDLDQLVTKVVGTDTFEYEYNNWGELSKAVKNGQVTEIIHGDNQEIKEVIDQNGQTIKYEYDLKGRRTAIVYPQGRVVEYEYDKYDRLVKVSDDKGITVYEYDEVGNIIIETSGNLITIRGYDLVGNLVTQTVSQDGEVISELSYNRNVLGSVIDEILTQDNKTITKSYKYDELNQITEETITDGSSIVVSTYSYDIWGNKDKVIKNDNGIVTETSYSHNLKQQLVEVRDLEGSIKLKYDERGNVSKKSYSSGLVEEYTFDDSNKLIKITDNYGREVEYEYDGLDERIGKKESVPYNYIVIQPEAEEVRELDIDEVIDHAKATVNKVIEDKYYCTVTFEDDSIKVINEEYINDITKEYTEVIEARRNNDVYQSYTYGITRLKTDTNEESVYHIVNGKLDVIGNIRLDDRSWIEYSLSGESSKSVRYGYSSESHEGTLQYLRARYYDTELGIFISKDTYRGSRYNQISQNRYIYTENNSINGIDPSGHSFKGLTNIKDNPLKVVGAKQADKGIASPLTGAFGLMDFGKELALNLEQSKNLKESGKIIGQINGVGLSYLTKTLERQESELKAKGYSSQEIAAKRLELIRKYCEEFDLDSVEVSKALSYYEKNDLEAKGAQSKPWYEQAWDGLVYGYGEVKKGADWVIGTIVDNVTEKIEMYIYVIKAFIEVEKWLLNFILDYAHIIIPLALAAAMIYFFPPSLLLTLPAGLSFGSIVTAGGLSFTTTMVVTTTVAIPTEIIAVSSALIMMLIGNGMSGQGSNSDSSTSNNDGGKGSEKQPQNPKKVSDNYLKENGIDAHELKIETLKEMNIKDPISHYNIYVDKVGDIGLQKNGSSTWIDTMVNIATGY